MPKAAGVAAFHMILVDVAAAVICFAEVCHPALVGRATPRGEFLAQHTATKLPGFGGDVLVFHEGQSYRMAIHRTWRGRERLYEAPSSNRVVTNGCINVEPEVYEALVACCAGGKVVIR